MILSIAAFLMSASHASAAAEPNLDSLPELFAAACLDGQARLSAGQVAAVSFDELPPDLRKRLGRPASGQVWQLRAPGRAYLYILNYEPREGVNPKICGLASDGMDLDDAADALEARIAGKVLPNRLRSTEWLRPQDGYVAIATSAADFNVLQINWLSEDQRAAALDYLQTVSQ